VPEPSNLKNPIPASRRKANRAVAIWAKAHIRAETVPNRNKLSVTDCMVDLFICQLIVTDLANKGKRTIYFNDFFCFIGALVFVISFSCEFML
jgi:hypothetical protein